MRYSGPSRIKDNMHFDHISRKTINIYRETLRKFKPVVKCCLQDTLSRNVSSEQPDCMRTSSLTALPPACYLLRRWRVRAGVTGGASRRHQEGRQFPHRAGFPSSPRVRLRGSDVPPGPRQGPERSLCCLSRASGRFSPQVHLS